VSAGKHGSGVGFGNGLGLSCGGAGEQGLRGWSGVRVWRGRCGRLSGRLCGLHVEVQNLVADLFKVGGLQILDELIPPVDVIGEAIGPVLDLELGELDGQVHDGDGDDLGLPLQA
jgi:hypothetical protein